MPQPGGGAWRAGCLAGLRRTPARGACGLASLHSARSSRALSRESIDPSGFSPFFLQRLPSRSKRSNVGHQVVSNVWLTLPVARGRLGHAGSYRASASSASNCGANLTGRNRFSGMQSPCMVSPTGSRAHDQWLDKSRLDGLIGSERSSPDKAYRRALAVMIRIAALVANWGGESARV